MRILWIAKESPAVAALSRLGHEVIRAEPSARRIASTALGHRPDGACLELSARAWHAAGALTALRIPYLVMIDRALAWTVSAAAVVRASRGVIAGNEALGRHAVDVLDAPDASIIPPGIDLDVFAPGDRDEAKRALGLEPSVRSIVLIDELATELRLDLLREAHRTLTGIGLLIASDGPRADFVQAMRAVTRPSSPVIFLGSQAPAERALAIRASELGVALAGGRAEFAACGRRQVSLQGEEAERIASISKDAVRICDASPSSLRAALEESLAAPALSDVAAIRKELGWEHSARQLAQLLEA